MKKHIALLVVISLFLVLPTLGERDVPFTKIVDLVEIKTVEDHHAREYPLPVYVKKGPNYESEDWSVEVSIAPRQSMKWQGGAGIEENKDKFFKVAVHIAIKAEGEDPEEFDSYLNCELRNCDADAEDWRLFWDKAGEDRADKAGQTFDEDHPLIMEKEYFKVTLELVNFTPAMEYCDTDEEIYINCESDADCIIFMDALTLKFTVDHSCDKCYTDGLEDLREGEDLFKDAADIDDYKEAIDKYEEARAKFADAQKQFEKVAAREAETCEDSIEKCDEEIDNLEGITKLRTRLLYIVVVIAVIAGIGVLYKKIGKRGKPKPKRVPEGLALKVQNAETGEEISLKVGKFDKIGRLRQQAGSELGIIPFEMLYRGKVCLPTKTVEECGLTDGAVVEIVPLKKELLERRYREGTITGKEYKDFKRELTRGPPPRVPKPGPSITFEGRAFDISKGSVAIGRGDKADIKIPDTERLVSRIHAKVYRDGKGQYWVEDNNSANGTFIYKDGKYQRIKKWALQNGDRIVLCHDPKGGKEFSLTFESGAGIGAPGEAARETRMPGMPGAAEIVVEGRTILLTKQVTTIGRGEDADIRVTDPESLVSRIHAKVYRDGKGQYWVEDNNSANGTFILKDGKYQRIKKFALYDGDTIALYYDASKGPHITLQFRKK